MTTVRFTKMHGLGNDFMVVDDTAGQLRISPQRIQQWADRHTGIGFDQLLIVGRSSDEKADFDYRIYNADGGEVEHCGNGARCFARFVNDKGLSEKPDLVVNTLRGLITLSLNEDDSVTVKMGVPQFEPDDVPFIAESDSLTHYLQVGNEQWPVGVTSIGNPHVLLEVEDLNTTPVERLGPTIEKHPAFPNRVNVGFMQIINRRHIRLRVFERAVGETQACGSGACAAVAIAHRQGKLDKHVTVSLAGGDLEILWPNLTAPIEMTGPCSTVFEGQTRL